MGRIEGALLVGDRPAPPHYGQTDSLIKLVDLSKHPVKNDRIAKLGNLWGTPGVLVCDYDPKSNRVSIADGILAPGTQYSLGPFEPDMWLYRIHSKFGADRVWAPRMIADHTNKHNEEKCRSTYVIDQQETQRQGHYSEVFWAKDVGVKLGSDLLKLNGAGQTAAICQQKRGGFRAPVASGGQGNPDDQRYHLCLNANFEAGFITDGSNIGQLRHVIVLDDWINQAFNADGERLVTAALPSDVIFSANPEQWGPLAFDCGGFEPTMGHVLTGYHWWFQPTDQCRVDRKFKDKSEDGKEIARRVPRKNIWVFVRKDPEWVPTGDGGKAPDPPPGPQLGFPAPLGGAAGPAAGGVGAFGTADYAAGVKRAESNVIPLPETLSPTWNMNVEVEFSSPVAGFLGPGVLVQFDYCVVPKGGSTAPVVVTGSFPRVLTPAAYPGLAKLYRLVFVIPAAQIKAAKGGKVVWALGRRGDIDATPDIWHVIGRASSFSPAIKAE